MYSIRMRAVRCSGRLGAGVSVEGDVPRGRVCVSGGLSVQRIFCPGRVCVYVGVCLSVCPGGRVFQHAMGQTPSPCGQNS